MLSKSKDKSLAAWGRAYINPAALYIDSASVKILEVKGLNTEVSESSPFVFQDKFYYVSEMMRLPRTYYTLNDDETQHIGGALKRDSLFLYPSILNERLHVLPIRGPFCFSPDGSVLYFCRPVSSRELQVKSKEPFFKYQLYTLTMSTLNDLQPEIKPFRYNRPEFNFMHPCISGDGKHLYFSSDMKGSAGGMDIFVSEWTSNGWSAPVNAGSQINTAGNEVFPSLAGNNGLYFSSDHLPGLGGLDIFYAAPSANKDLRFEEAENVGAYMNSRFDDFGVYSDKAGRGYFSSNRKNNTDDDIYYFFRIK